MLRHRNFQSVIGPLNLEAAFYSILTFNFRFNRALISHSGAVVRHRNFQSVIGPLNLGSRPLKAAFNFSLIKIWIQSSFNRQVLCYDKEIFKV